MGMIDSRGIVDGILRGHKIDFISYFSSLEEVPVMMGEI